MRAAVLGGIPVQPVDPATERVLWRLDADEPRQPALFVVTRSRPSWEHIVEQAGWPGADRPQAETRPYGPFLDRIASGDHYAFRMTANPVEARSSDARTSSRLGHRTVAHQMRWLRDRAPGLGIDLQFSSADEAEVDVAVTGRERRSFRRAGQEGLVTIQVVTYEGRLEVRDPTALRAALLSGVGPAKAYGCGLLTLAPLAVADH